MNNNLPDRLDVGQVKHIMRLLQIGLNNTYDKRNFSLTAINPQDIVDLIKGDK
jgi:hypothetical protein